jgi:hypothetical protein
MTMSGTGPADARDGRQSDRACDIFRGTGRMLAAHGMAVVGEVPLANGRRADLVAVGRNGEIWIAEIKSCLEDFRGDRKWPEYREFCDRLYFAVAPAFPRETLPPDCGVILADRYGGDFMRDAPDHTLAPARRKAMTLRLLRLTALRLQRTIDPGADLEMMRAD